MKLILHLVVFLAGAGLGIWWGVNHPAEAQNISAQEQAAISKGKIEIMTKLLGRDAVKPESTAEFKQMLSDEQQKLQDAKSKLGN